MKTTVAQARRTSAESMRAKAYLHIQRKIASRELAAGDSLSELALARELGSSRTPIREAIGQLAAEGFLEQSPNRGAVVVRLTRQDVVELYELREALEVFAVGKAARGPVRPSEMERLEGLVNDIQQLRAELDRSGRDALDARQMHRFVACDLGFHALLMRVAGNSRILKVVNETRLLIRIFAIRRAGHRPIELENIHRQHHEILRAVAERHPERAIEVLSEHIQNSCRERLDAYDQWDREDSLRRTLPESFAMTMPSSLR